MAMRQSWVLKRQLSSGIPTDVGERVAAFMRRVHPVNTAKLVASDTGMPVTTVSKLLERKSAPNSSGFVALTLAYGPDFLAAVVPRAPAWLDRAVRAERQAALEAEQARIERELMELRR